MTLLTGLCRGNEDAPSRMWVCTKWHFFYGMIPFRAVAGKNVYP
jgi:hypothetical protein